MCGRYALLATVEELVRRYGLAGPPDFNYPPQSEIFPSRQAPVVILGQDCPGGTSRENTKRLKLFKWGFALAFTSRPIINARAETVDRKATFKKAFLHRRCLIPVTGFYEWKDAGGKKIRYRVRLKGQPIFSLAGIYDRFRDGEGKPFEAFTIITISASAKIKSVHERMPVIIGPDNEELWLNREVNPLDLKDLLTPYNDEEIALEAVSGQMTLDLLS